MGVAFLADRIPILAIKELNILTPMAEPIIVVDSSLMVHPFQD
jgi:hypothetical protein